jgi:hypothetical protein
MGGASHGHPATVLAHFCGLYQVSFLNSLSLKIKGFMKFVQPKPLAIAWCFLFTLAMQSGSALAQTKMSAEEEAIYRSMVKSAGMNPDMQMGAIKQNENAQRWTDAKLIHYHIVGVYQGKPNITSDPGKGSGFADVTDSVEIDLDWNLSESKPVGSPRIQNSKSTVKNPQDSERSCLPPILKGEYEHYELLGIKEGLGGALELQVKTSYPVVEVVQQCTGSRKPIPSGSKTRSEALVVPSPVMFGMALPDSDKLRISPDKKSMIQKNGGWTWTFTPSVKK